jgi:hypothetical protein
MHRWMLAALVAVAATSMTELRASAEDAVVRPAWPVCASASVRESPWTVDWSLASAGSHEAAPVPAPALVGVSDAAAQTAPRRARPVAFEYSEAYKVRSRIHKIASFVTLPLFVAEYVVGSDLYNHTGSTSDSKRNLHSALAGSIGVLFGVNTITGVWNLVEARKDPNHRALRTIHGVLMMVADAGFVATGATAPESEHFGASHGPSRSTHRAIAISSMGVAAASYLLMLIGGH